VPSIVFAAELTSATAFFNPDATDPRGWLEQALGPVGEFEIVDQSSRSMVVIRPGERGSTAAYARLHGLTLEAAKSRLRRDFALHQEWQDAWDRNADWSEHRVRLGRYSASARVSPQARPEELLGTLGFEVVEAKTRPSQKSAAHRPRRPLSTPAALGRRRGLVHSVRWRRTGLLFITNLRIHGWTSVGRSVPAARVGAANAILF
jgi:hypothetical protein